MPRKSTKPAIPSPAPIPQPAAPAPEPLRRARFTTTECRRGEFHHPKSFATACEYLRTRRADLKEVVDAAEHAARLDATNLGDYAIDLIDAVRLDAIARLYEHLERLPLDALASALKHKDPSPVTDGIVLDERNGGGCASTQAALDGIYGQLSGVTETILDAVEENVPNHGDLGEAVTDLVERFGHTDAAAELGDRLDLAWHTDRRAAFDALVRNLKPDARSELAEALTRA